MIDIVIREQGIKPQPEKVSSIQEVPTPVTVRDVQSFLGLCNYYRRFVKDYAKVAAPLNKLLVGHKNEKGRKRAQPLTWNAEAQEAFETLKHELTKKIVLAYPDFTKKFILTTDASDFCVG